MKRRISILTDEAGVSAILAALVGQKFDALDVTAADGPAPPPKVRGIKAHVAGTSTTKAVIDILNRAAVGGAGTLTGEEVALAMIDVGFADTSASSALSRLSREGAVLRSGKRGRYRYQIKPQEGS